MITAGRRSRTGTPGRGGAYRRLLTGIGVSNVGDGVGLIAFPWLASAVTRSPALIAVVIVAQRLPWLLFALPAGVLADRFDRRRLVVGADAARAVIVGALVIAVWSNRRSLSDLSTLESAPTRVGLYVALLVVTVLLGVAEVVGDSANQTLMPSLVTSERLEHANGRLWAVEQVTNTLVGPALGSLLLLVSFSLPFVAQMVAFAVGAAIVASLGPLRAPVAAQPSRDTTFIADLRDGISWLWRHRVLRTLAFALAMTSGASAIGASTYVLFAQEVMGIGPLLFAIVGFGGAIGAVTGGIVTPLVIERIGPARALSLSALGLCGVALGIALWPTWPVVAVLSIAEFLCVTVWSVVTVSYRQRAIPDELLGRVNSAYRWVGWGSIPVGAALGGWIVTLADTVVTREWALRSVWFVAALAYALVLLLVTTRLDRAMLQPDLVVRARRLSR